MAPQILRDTIKFLPYMMKLPSRHAWFDYDKGADVAYVTFEKPQQADDTEIFDNGVLVRKRGERIVGVTFLNVSKL